MILQLRLQKILNLNNNLQTNVNFNTFFIHKTAFNRKENVRKFINKH